MREEQKQLTKLKKEFIEFLKKDILKYYDGFNYYQKMNLLCDDITPNIANNAVYHGRLSNENFIKLVEAVMASSHSYKMKDDRFFRAAELIKWKNFMR